MKSQDLEMKRSRAYNMQPTHCYPVASVDGGYVVFNNFVVILVKVFLSY
jgi:hypothetical protein